MSTRIRYGAKLTEKICQLLAEGQSLKAICKSKDMPSVSTVNSWRKLHPEFDQAVAEAKLNAVEAWIEEEEQLTKSGPPPLHKLAAQFEWDLEDVDASMGRKLVDAWAKWKDQRLSTLRSRIANAFPSKQQIHVEHSGDGVQIVSYATMPSKADSNKETKH